MFIREEIEAKSAFALRKKVREMKKMFCSVEVLKKPYWMRQRCTGKVTYYVLVRYDDGTPLPEIRTDFDYKTFASEKERTEYINRNCVTNYWLGDFDKHCCDGHIWALWINA